MIGEYLLDQVNVAEGRTPGANLSVVIHVDRTPVALWIHVEDD
jgi:hypothetical protein